MNEGRQVELSIQHRTIRCGDNKIDLSYQFAEANSCMFGTKLVILALSLTRKIEVDQLLGKHKESANPE